jgi:methylthioribose-1-phosphate isomerase
VRLLDQTLLPGQVRSIRIGDAEAMRDAIRRLAVRGAPAIGIAAAYGVVLAARSSRAKEARALERDVRAAIARLASARPTAVNLRWALNRMEAALERSLEEEDGKRRGALPARVRAGLLEEARAIHREDENLCSAIGAHGAALIRDGSAVLTHCNAGALATGGCGTALAAIYAAAGEGKAVRVYADETRPLLQGARLTAWELRNAGIDVTVLCDNAAPSLLRSGEVQCVIVGADRIAANGDVANKIGTYGVAVLARENGVPFYVAAPTSTFDPSIRRGEDIPIEERAADEVLEGFGKRTAPPGVSAYNPAFDVTPARYITGIITEAGVLRPPYGPAIRRLLGPVTGSRSSGRAAGRPSDRGRRTMQGSGRPRLPGRDGRGGRSDRSGSGPRRR